MAVIFFVVVVVVVVAVVLHCALFVFFVFLILRHPRLMENCVFIIYSIFMN